jgi:hypothetical protein
LKPWHFVCEPSHPCEVQALVRIRPAVESLLTTSFLALAAVWCAQFYQAEPAPVAGTTKRPESLCLMLALPSSGSRVTVSSKDITPRSSLLRTHSPIPMPLPAFGKPPRARNLCRLLPAPAATGTFPTLSLRIFPMMPGPLSRRLAECIYLVLPLPQRPSPLVKLGRLTVTFRLSDFTAERVFATAAISLCSSLTVCSPPWSLLPRRFPAGQLVAFTSGQNVLCYRRTHRIC